MIWYDMIWWPCTMLICVHSVQMLTVFSCECALATNRYPLVMTSVLCCGKPQCLHNGSTDSKPFSWVKLPEGKALNRALIFFGNLSIVIPKWWTVMQFILEGMTQTSTLGIRQLRYWHPLFVIIVPPVLKCTPWTQTRNVIDLHFPFNHIKSPVVHSYGHLSVISTYNPIYRMCNPIYNQL